MIFSEIINNLYSEIFDELDDDLYDFSLNDIFENSLSEYNTPNDSFNEKIYYKKYKSGEIYIVEYQPEVINQIILMEYIAIMIKMVIDYSYLGIQKDSEYYDDIEYSLITVITFETEEGFRVEEKVLYSNNYKNLIQINQIIYLDFVKERLIKLFEEYHIKSIELIKVKVF